MKTTRQWIFLLALLSSSLCAEETRIQLRADLWFPVNGEPRAARPGFGIEILNAVWTSAGYRIDYRLMPWRRSLDLAHSGKADCVIGAYLTDAPEMLYPLEPLAFDGIGLYMLAGKSLEYTGPRSLQGHHVGIIGGYSYGAEFDAWAHSGGADPAVEVMQGSEALEKNIRKLLSGRLDVLVESPLVMQAKLESMHLESKIQRVANVSEAMPIFVACGPGRGAREWLNAFDTGMKELRRSGRLQEIYRRYGIDAQRQEHLRLNWPGRAVEMIAPPAVEAEAGDAP